MDNKEFERLIESVKEAGDIKRGEKGASREFSYSTQEVKQIGEELESTKSKTSR